MISPINDPEPLKTQEDAVRYFICRLDADMVINLCLRLSEPASPNQKIIDRNPELAFLLGRFRKDCKILSAEEV